VSLCLGLVTACSRSEPPRLPDIRGAFQRATGVVWLDDMHIYFLQRRSADSPDTELWVANVDGGAAKVPLKTGCGSSTFRGLRSAGNQRLLVFVECAEDELSSPALIDLTTDVVAKFAVPAGTIDLLLEDADPDKKWAQYYSDGCISLSPLEGGADRFPVSPSYRPAILPASFGSTVYFLTTKALQCEGLKDWDLIRHDNGGDLELGSFVNPSALAVSSHEIVVAAERDGTRGVWRVTPEEISLIAEGDFREITISPNEQSLLALSGDGSGQIIDLKATPYP